MNTINDIVELSQVQAGQMKPVFSVIDIQKLIQDQISRFKPEALVKGLKFNANIELSGFFPGFTTDIKKLQAILFHLIGNALKFTQAGSIDFSVRADDGILEFCIKDTGIGISQNSQQIIFSQFMQADYSNTRKFEGSGLGLTLTKAYIEMLNGKLWLESEEGKGSSFYFSIPDKNRFEKTEMIGKLSDEKSTNGTKNLKILIAEGR